VAKLHRITAGEDYRATVRRGYRVGGKFSIAHAVFCAHGGHGGHDDSAAKPARFGYIVSKAVGIAVVRNLVRRRMKAITDEFVREGLGGVDLVFRATAASADASFAELDQEMRRQVAKLETLRSAKSLSQPKSARRNPRQRTRSTRTAVDV
jgi:ribonuclease P protein component